jgi:hypothetical protein
MAVRKWLIASTIVGLAATSSLLVAQEGTHQGPVPPGAEEHEKHHVTDESPQLQMDCPMMGSMMGQGKMEQGMGGMMGQGMEKMPMMGMMHGPMLEGRLAYVKAELGITEAQAAAWKEYEEAVRANAESMQDMHQTMMQAMRAGSAVEKLEKHAAAMEARAKALEALKEPTTKLYEALSPEQKQKADRLLGTGLM